MLFDLIMEGTRVVQAIFTLDALSIIYDDAPLSDHFAEFCLGRSYISFGDGIY